ncbi:YD repeat protein [Pseudomonas reidholzensis]|uniref:YD repeat protein n=2 Tax=Pseudomonas reidholzensis TaxID=1785162 RepID=A0A383RTP9_9PSED|nr:YD repeat protein [Pseudomonas reidholzensis]
MASVTRPGDQENTELVCTDAQRSPLNGASRAGLRSMQFAAYGYTAPSTLPVGFKGERLDPITTHYLLGRGYRAYNPVLMRFNSPDGDSPFDKGGLNTYAFVLGDPVNFSDPSGHGIGPFISPQLRTTRPYVTFGKPRTINPQLKSIIVTQGQEVGKPGYDMTTIVGHGTGSTVGGLTPEQLLKGLKKEGIALESGPIHLVSCYGGATAMSGDSRFPATAFGQTLSNMTNKPVITYQSKIINTKTPHPTSPTVEINLLPDQYLDAEPVTFYPETHRSTTSMKGLLKQLTGIRTKK